VSEPGVETPPNKDADVRALTRPADRLLWLYMIRSLALGPLFPLMALLLYFKFKTLTYRFDDEGVTVSWGILVRQESLTGYVKIQDIHVHRGFVERWMGLATVQVQTAGGGTHGEVLLEGLEDHDAVRDFLYRRMRGHEQDHDTQPAAAAVAGAEHTASEAEALALLRGLKDELDGARRALEARR
jgi:uncharacterized membrane protein YdbT with pleckstrin-like domain